MVILPTNATSHRVEGLVDRLLTAHVSHIKVFVGLSAKATSLPELLRFIDRLSLRQWLPFLTAQLVNRTITPMHRKWRQCCIAVSIWGMWSSALVERPRGRANAVIFLEEDTVLAGRFFPNMLRALALIPKPFDYFNAHPLRPLGPTVRRLSLEICEPYVEPSPSLASSSSRFSHGAPRSCLL